MSISHDAPFGAEGHRSQTRILQWTIGLLTLLTLSMGGCFAPEEDLESDVTTGTGEADECPDGEPPQACGGCEPLGVTLDAPCGACDTGRFACVGDQADCVGDQGTDASEDACGPDALCLDGDCLRLAPCEADHDCPVRAGYVCLDGRCEIPVAPACLAVAGRAMDPHDPDRLNETSWEMESGQSLALILHPVELPGTTPWTATWVTVEAPPNASIESHHQVHGDREALRIELTLQEPGGYAFHLQTLEDANGMERCSDGSQTPDVMVTVTPLTCGEPAPVDLLTDDQHCGACLNTCAPNFTCVEGTCEENEPSEEPWPAAWATLEEEALVEINRIRAMGASCGETPHAPAPALTLDLALQEAARLHSLDMGTRDFHSHINPDNEGMADRIQAAGYTGSPPFAENLGAGHSIATSMVNGWVSSIGHCTHLMNPALRHAGVGFASVEGSQNTRYWTLVMGGGP